MKLERIYTANTLTFYLRIYVMIVAQDIKTRLTYRIDFLISLAAITATNLIGVLSFFLISYNFKHILNWRYYELLFLYAFVLITTSVTDIFFDNNWNLKDSVYSGDFIKYKFRPINPFFYYMSEIFNAKAIGQFVIGFVMLVLCWIKLDLAISFTILLNLLIRIFTSSLVMAAIMNIAAASSFWIVNSRYIMMMIYKFKDYARYPLSIYSPFFKLLFSTLIPIGFIAYYPSLDFLSVEKVTYLTVLSPVFGIALFTFSYNVWMKGCNLYDGTGS